jgi:hypothetical protein
VLAFAVDDHRRALGAVAVLVDVGGHGGDTRNAEVEGRNRRAEAFQEGEQEASETRIGVERDAPFGGEGRELGNGVDDSERIVGRRADDEGGPVGKELLHRVDVGAVVPIHGRLHELEPEVLRRLGEGGMGGHGRQQLGLLDAALGTGPVSGRFHGHQDALGAARRHRAGCVVACVEQISRHRDDVGLHAAQARETEGIQRVLVEVELVGVAQHGVDVFAGGIDQAPGLPAAPVGVALFSLAHPRHHVVTGYTGCGKLHSGLRSDRAGLRS